MIKNIPVTVLFAVLFLISFPLKALAAEILGPEIIIQDNEIIVNTGLSNLEEFETAIMSGIEKEIIFTIELFKSWSLWPDEFVVSKKTNKTIKYDNLRERFLVSSFDGTSQIRKNFKNFNSMMAWAFMVERIKLANTRELEPGSYYLRVVVESKSRELPPVIGLLMLFIPEVEMSLAKESRSFNIGDSR